METGITITLSRAEAEVLLFDYNEKVLAESTRVESPTAVFPLSEEEFLQSTEIERSIISKLRSSAKDRGIELYEG